MALAPAGQVYEFSWRWGVEGDPGDQGYHGLKEKVDDNFIVVGKAIPTWIGANSTSYAMEGAGTYLWTTIMAPCEILAHALTGAIKPAKVWLNGAVVTGGVLRLKAGANPLVLEYGKPGRTYFVASTEASLPESKISALAMSWHNDPTVLPFDVRAGEAKPVGWYRFTSPPGLQAMTVTARGKVQAWVGGRELAVSGNKWTLSEVSALPVEVMIRIEQERGCYGGAALLEPICMECVPGFIALGDWSAIDGLLSYSGGAWYRKTVFIPASKEVILDLGAVAASAEVRVNGQSAGVRVASPWRFEITQLVKPGENRIEILVCNTLANHYTTVPTRYRGETTSGLLGPVKIETIH